MPDTKKLQIEAILKMEYSHNLGPLCVSPDDIRQYVTSNGLPKDTHSAGDIRYKKVNDKWVLTYFEKNINIGSKEFSEELELLEEILSEILRKYKRWNP